MTAPLGGRRSDAIHAAPFEQGEIGPDLFHHACLMGLEGLVSKRVDSRSRRPIARLDQEQKSRVTGHAPGEGLAQASFNLFEGYRQFEKIFRQTKPRVLVNRIPSRSSQLKTFVRSYPELQRLAFCHQDERRARTTSCSPCWPSACFSFRVGCSGQPEPASRGAELWSAAGGGAYSFEICSYLHVGIGEQGFNPVGRDHDPEPVPTFVRVLTATSLTHSVRNMRHRSNF